MSMQDGEVTGQVTEQEQPVPMNERPIDGPGSGRSKLRGQLERSVEDTRKRDEPRQPRRAPAKGADTEVEAKADAPAEVEGETAPAEVETEQPQVDTKPPEAWTRDAKANWEKLPDPVRAAVLKREEDMAKGVQELKQRQGEIDNVLSARTDYIKKLGHTPATAIHQLFSWFEALSNNPAVAFPALAQSCGFDLKSLNGQPQAQPTPPPQPGQPEAAQPEPWRDELQRMQQAWAQQFGSLQQTFQQQSFQKTEEILGSWSKDKPHFEEVRGMMARLISPGPNGEAPAIPPLANGMADLDRAYDYAVYAMPEVRHKVLAAQQQKTDAERKAKETAEKKAQQEQADKARRAAGSLSGGAPGTPAEQQKKGKSKSVKESLLEALSEARS